MKYIFFIIAMISFSTDVMANESKADAAIAAVKKLCLVGSQFDLTVDANGNLSLVKLMPSAKGNASVNVRASNGAAAIFDDQVRRLADRDIRDCIKPHISKIIDAILNDGDNKKIKSNVSKEGNTQLKKKILEVIEDRINEIYIAQRDASKLKIDPSLMTFQETIETSNRINDEQAIFDTKVNLLLLHRYTRDYGSKKINDEFGSKINAVSDQHRNLRELMSSLASHFAGEERLNNIDYVNRIYSEVVERLNARNRARSDLYTFIANLHLSDFTPQ